MASTKQTAADRQTTRSNWLMPIIVLLGVAAAIVMAFLGSGALGGTAVSEAAGGALSSDATPLAPASTAFSIWSVIYLGLAGYAVWQLSATARDSARQHTLRPWAILSALLNAAWLWMIQLDLLLVSVLVILVLLAVLIRIMYILGAPRTGGWVELGLTDGTFGLYFGWVLVAAFANAFAWLAAEGVTAVEDIPLGIVGIVVAAAIAGLVGLRSSGRIAPALASAWGLAWIAVARREGDFDSSALVWIAALGAVLVLLAAILTRIRAQ